jgi:hypothetical protein
MSLEHRDFVRPRASSRWRSGSVYRELKGSQPLGWILNFGQCSGRVEQCPAEPDKIW